MLPLAIVSTLLLSGAIARTVPAQAQVIDQKSFNVLESVLPATEANGTTTFVPPGTNADSLIAKPFHIYDDEFYDIIGCNPTLTLIAGGGTDPLYHEATVWIRDTDEIFFAQNAGAPAAGTGLNKSAIYQKIALSEAAAAAATGARNASGTVKIVTIDSDPQLVNPNGGTNYKGQILIVGDGQGNDTAPAVSLLNPRPPYNTTVLLNNYFGRQFNSIDDVAVNPRNREIYFTDPTYGYVQDFRPEPGVPKQVWRFNEDTGAVSVVADGFNMPNGIAFTANGSHVYVTDTGLIQSFFGFNSSFPATIYRYSVSEDGRFHDREVFAFVDTGVPDGIHLDTNGNVYAATGDGVHVYNPSGKLIGKIYLGITSANFQFAGKGRMVILAETELYYATLAAEGLYIEEDL